MACAVGKLTKVKPASKVSGTQNGHGRQASIESFFRKKSELPSPLFTQVIPKGQKVKPTKPEPVAKSALFSPGHRSGASTNIQVEIRATSLFSQIEIIPGTPDNVGPKKRSFTGRVRDRKSISGKEDPKGSGRQHGKIEATAEKRKQERQPLSYLNSKVQSDTKLSESDLAVEHGSHSSTTPKEILSLFPTKNDRSLKQIDEDSGPFIKRLKLSRKFNRLAKSDPKVIPQNEAVLNDDQFLDTGDNGDVDKESEKENSEDLPWFTITEKKNSVKDVEFKMKPIPLKSPLKKSSRLSLSRKPQTDGTVKSINTSTKRSPHRGNSPNAKRLQRSEGLEDLQVSPNVADSVEKSLLEQYGYSKNDQEESSDDSASVRRSSPPAERYQGSENLQVHQEDAKSVKESLFEQCVCSKNDTERLSGNSASLKSNSLLASRFQRSEGDCGLQVQTDGEDSVKKSPLEQGCSKEQLEQDGPKKKMVDSASLQDPITSCIAPQLQEDCERSKEEEKDFADDFITVIPDTCPPTGEDEEQEILVIPDTCPSSSYDTPSKDRRDTQSTSCAITLGAISGPKLEPGDLQVQLGSENSSGISKVETFTAAQESLHESVGFGSPQDISDMDASNTFQESPPELNKVDQSRTNSNSQDDCDKAHLCEPHPQTSGQEGGTTCSQGFDTGGVPSPGTAALLEGIDDSFFDDLDLEQLDQIEGKQVASINKQFAELSPFKQRPAEGSRQTKLPEWRPADLCRYEVTGIKDDNHEKVLELISMTDQSVKTCVLKDTWQHTLLDVGMVVAIHGETSDAHGRFVISGQQGYLVVNPDHLLTGTAVSNSIRCMRRSVLSENFKGLERGNRAMLLGSLLHEVFDQAILKNEFQKPKLVQIARDVLKQPAFLCDMYSLKIDENNLLEDVGEYADAFKRWRDSYFGGTSKGRTDIKWPGSMKSEQCGVSVAKVVDIEDTIWSPRWGVKGKVDLTVNVKIHRPSSSKPVEHTLPLELKTGRETNSTEHRSQLILYSLMLGDLQPSPDLGFLLYLKTAAMKAVPANHLDKRELVNLRNQLAFHLSRKSRTFSTDADGQSATLAPPLLPEPIQDDFTCSRCAHLQSCSMLQRLNGSTQQLSPTMETLFTESINHLLDSHVQYFAHWYLLCALEHEASQKRNTTRNIWCKKAINREQDGECWSGMCLQSSMAKDQQHGGFSLVFCRKQGADNSILDKCVMTQGDRVVVSVEGTRRVAVCVGFIESITASVVKISTDTQLKPEACRGVMYRIDKDDSYNSMAASLVNLAKLMNSENAKLRNIVIDKQAPTSILKPNLPPKARSEVATIFTALNKDQQAAIKAVLRSQDYTLIIGMPGTGKTTTIVALVRILVACHMSVLLTSYTHSAVDNILLKLMKHKIDFLRLGAQHNIHPQLRQYSDSRLMKRTSGISELATAMERKRVVATTSLGMKHALFSRHSFDVCIVDEASQISQPVCLGPLFSADKFVLVGDQCQLPPLVQSSRARDLGMDESLFDRLVSAHDSTAIRLGLQFRMNAGIMALSNHLVYDGAMKCGNEAVAMGTISSDWDEWSQTSDAESWLVEALNPKTIVSFLNTDQIADKSDVSNNTSKLEARLVRDIVASLVQCGCTAEQIGVISPYRRQCQLLTSELGDLGSKVKGVEVNTVDKYQGRDKDVIVVSFSHSKMDTQGGSILSDLRRLNVAITRAKHKLLLIGNLKVLCQFPPIQKLADFLLQQDQVRNLPCDASNSLQGL